MAHRFGSQKLRFGVDSDNASIHSGLFLPFFSVEP
jgi:hypothetical protein